jgi:antitoxin component YwqK of YwqJK toxin-antitoxin module
MHFLSHCIITVFCCASLATAAQELDRHVVRKYPDGKAKVVVYMPKGATASNARVKEEVYFPNGNLDYVGHYKNGQEHGKWTYYWESGKIKSEEFYIRGLEEGIMWDYDSNGKKIKEYEYKKGVLLRETKL